MAAPGTAFDDPILGKDRQPAHMKDYVVTSEDNGGVHINSGIPSHAFYTAAMELGGPAWEVAGRVWYGAVQHPVVTARTDFAEFAGVTLDVAARRYGTNSDAVNAVRTGWAKVGVQPAG
jgi:Zn-dependent metalloprotease